MKTYASEIHCGWMTHISEIISGSGIEYYCLVSHFNFQNKQKLALIY